MIFQIVSNFTRLTACEITYNNFEISLVVFIPNITTNHAITYTNTVSPGLLRRKKKPLAVNVGSKHDETEIYNRITSLRCTKRPGDEFVSLSGKKE